MSLSRDGIEIRNYGPVCRFASFHLKNSPPLNFLGSGNLLPLPLGSLTSADSPYPYMYFEIYAKRCMGIVPA